MGSGMSRIHRCQEIRASFKGMSRTPRRRIATGAARGIRPPARTANASAASSAAPHATVHTIGTLITALTAIGALVFTGLSLNATRDQVEVAQQGQYTDRYTKAVEQLDQTGPEHLQTRLGGIYALRRLTVDSPRDQPTIINVLVTFITATIQRNEAMTDRPDSYETTCSDRIAPDIQAAVTALIERDRARDADTAPDREMFLFEACMASGQFNGAQLIAADLDSANLNAANLNAANLRGASLRGAHLHRADLREVNLHGADVNAANLSGADLRGAYLRGADLTGADLTWADLTGADLRGANLTEADLREADLTKADLTGATLTMADLKRANLQDSRHKYTLVDNAETDSETKGKWW